MSQIDKFIEALHKYKSENLEVMAGAQVTLGVKGSQRAVTAQPVTAEQVERLVNEIMPQAGEGVTNGPQGESFTYKAPSGVVTVNVTRPNGSLRLLIKPLDEAAAALAMNGNSEMAARPRRQVRRRRPRPRRQVRRRRPRQRFRSPGGRWSSATTCRNSLPTSSARSPSSTTSTRASRTR